MSDNNMSEEEGGEIAARLSTKSSKRKHLDDPEIEINLDLPEPVSKKAKRLEKKSKQKPPRQSDEKNVTSTNQSSSNHELKNAARSLAKAYFNSDTAQSPQSSQIAQKRSEYGIWIGNLSFKTTRESLRDFLDREGGIEGREVVRLHLPTTPVKIPAGGEKAQNKGFAYIDFATKEGLEKALGLSEKLLDGRRVLIKNAKNFEGRPAKADDAPSTNGAKKAPSQRVFVGNLGFDVTKEELADHFCRAGTVEDVFIATFEDTGKCKGFGWVRFEDIEAATAAVKGYVLDKEGQDSGDGLDVDGSDEQDVAKVDGDSKATAKKQKKVKHWINRLHGRQLRVEFAEDAQTRYKKRFTGNGSKDGASKPSPHERGVRRASPDYEVGAVADVITNTEPQEHPKSNTKDMDKTKRVGDKDQRREERRKRHEKIDGKVKAHVVPQKASGAIVAGAGKKMKFDD